MLSRIAHCNHLPEGEWPRLALPGGVIHQGVDDICLMTGLPNMTAVEAGDATDMAT